MNYWTEITIYFLFYLVMGVIIMHIAAHMAKFKDPSLIRAFVVSAVATMLILFLGSLIAWGSVIALVAVLFVIKPVYETDWDGAVKGTAIYLILFSAVRFIFTYLSSKGIIPF
jgi:hypothetical protein